LGANGFYYFRTANGCDSSLSSDIKDRAGPMDKIKMLFLGKDNAYYFLKFDGSRGWELKGQYPRLNQALEERTEAPLVSSKWTHISEDHRNAKY
jgi:hypothetical protein